MYHFCHGSYGTILIEKIKGEQKNGKRNHKLEIERKVDKAKQP